jgi:hypothetical protein
VPLREYVPLRGSESPIGDSVLYIQGLASLRPEPWHDGRSDESERRQYEP